MIPFVREITHIYYYFELSTTANEQGYNDGEMLQGSDQKQPASNIQQGVKVVWTWVGVLRDAWGYYGCGVHLGRVIEDSRREDIPVRG